MLSAEQKRELDDIGFIVLPAFFSGEDMARIAAWLGELEHKQPAPGKEAMYYEQSSISGDNILVRIENFLGNYKLPGCRPDKLHQDQPPGDIRARYYAGKWTNYPPNDAEHARSSDPFRV